MQNHWVAARRIRHPRITPVFGLVCVAWLVLIDSAAAGNVAVIRHDRLIQGGPPLWLATLFFLAGWQVMLWAMMASPSLGVIDRYRGLRDKFSFLVGYLGVWTAFGLAAFLSDVGVHATVNHSPWLSFRPWLVAGGILVLAGTYQLSDLKAKSLTACRLWQQGNRQRGAADPGSLRAGRAYGLQCLGASWALMLLAFALGIGSLEIMAAITAVMVWEAVSPSGTAPVKIVGYALIVVGVAVLAGRSSGPYGSADHNQISLKDVVLRRSAEGEVLVQPSLGR
jgi:Predicted metal-binding integral membrane protein (DUF2182)